MKSFKIIALLAFMTIASRVEAQSTTWRVAYNLTELQGDFGQGIQIETPSFLKNSITVKLRGNQMYLNDYIGGENKWSNFWLTGVGVSNKPSRISKAISLYGEGGVLLMLPTKEISNAKTEFGGYGLFGFNFHYSDQFCYFLEAGSAGSGAEASNTDSRRVYANGFLINVGFKIMLSQSNKESSNKSNK